MPRVFTKDIFSQSSEKVTAYADKHTPIIECEKIVKRNEKMKVKVYVGDRYVHPNTADHYFAYIQLWNLETLIAEVCFQSGAFGNITTKTEIDFYIVPKLSMRLTAHAYCTKHGLWKSTETYIKVTD